MTSGRIILRSLLHRWPANACVIIALAIATAVVSGSLLVGDSIRGSLHQMALAGIGRIDLAVSPPASIRSALAEDLMRVNPACRAAAVIEANGVTRLPDVDEAGSARVTVYGVDRSFWTMFPASADFSPPAGKAIAISSGLARAMDLTWGRELLLTLERSSPVPGSSLFARRRRDQTVRSIRLLVGQVLDDSGLGGFSLQPRSEPPRSIFIDRDVLARAIEAPDSANLLLISAAGQSAAAVQQSLDQASAIRDYGLRLVSAGDRREISIESPAIVLARPQELAVERAAAAIQARTTRISVQLAARIAPAAEQAPILSYAIVAAIDPPAQSPSDGLDDDAVALNEWAVQDLAAVPGQQLQLRILAAAPDGDYREEPYPLILRKIIPLPDAAIDPPFTPQLEGMSRANRIDQWDLPFPIDLKRITARDEDYWEMYRATPKAFVSMGAMQKMWAASMLADPPCITSIRVASPAALPAGQFEARFQQELLRQLPLSGAQLPLRPLRQQLLDAAHPSTDFSGLLLAMGLFLIAAASGLAGTLMQLGARRRAAEVGLLLACGWSGRAVLRLLLWEGAILAAAGAALGVPAGMLYCRFILRALSSLWSQSALALHARSSSMAIGGLAGLVVGLLCAFRAARSLNTRSILVLLAGWQRIGPGPARSRSGGFLAWLLAAAGIGFPLVSLVNVRFGPILAFFIGGACLLAAGILWVHRALSRIGARAGGAQAPSFGRISVLRLAARNAATNRAQSVLVVCLLACASFMLVAVAANRRAVAPSGVEDRAGGTGGFDLRITTSLPLKYDLSTESGRRNQGFSDSDLSALSAVAIIPFLSVPGDDIGCRSLGRAVRPNLLGASPAAIDRGGFSVELASLASGANPWGALNQEHPDGAIPVFGDRDSVQWILHSGLGRVISVPGPGGEPVRLRIAGLIRGSLFANELIMSEANLRRLYGQSALQSYFLVDAPRQADQANISRVFRRALDDYGLEVQPTSQIVAGFLAVQNLYLSMFLTLGGLGMLLGAGGMLAVIIRNAIERQKELALMLACGVPRRRLLALLATEHAGLLALGLLLGTAAAVLAVAPALAQSHAGVTWLPFTFLLLAIAAMGLLGCLSGALVATRGNLLHHLRHE